MISHKRIIETATNPGNVVMDFFSGSGTVAKVAADLKRRFICCDKSEFAFNVAKDRLIKAGHKSFLEISFNLSDYCS